MEEEEETESAVEDKADEPIYKPEPYRKNVRVPERRMRDTGRQMREQRQPVVINGWQCAAGMEKLMARVIPSYTTPTETLERKEKERDMERKQLEQLRNFSRSKPHQGYRQNNSPQERPMAPVSRPRVEKIGENTKQPRQQQQQQQQQKQIRKSNDVDTSSFTGYAAMFCADIVKPSGE